MYISPFNNVDSSIKNCTLSTTSYALLASRSCCLYVQAPWEMSDEMDAYLHKIQHVSASCRSILERDTGRESSGETRCKRAGIECKIGGESSWTGGETSCKLAGNRVVTWGKSRGRRLSLCEVTQILADAVSSSYCVYSDIILLLRAYKFVSGET